MPQHNQNAQHSSSSHFMSIAAPLETAILACLISDPSLIVQVREYISHSDFLNPSAKKIYAWIEEKTRGDVAISESVIFSSFKNTPEEMFVMQVMAEFPDDLSITGNAQALRDISVKRSLFDQANAIQRSVIKGENIDAMLSKLSRGVTEANARLDTGKSTMKSARDISTKWRESFVDRCDSGDMPGLPTGFDDLDELTAGLHPSDLIIVAGRPSMGKTTFAMNIIEEIVLKQDKCAIVFSLEMPGEALFQRMIASVGDVDYENLKRGKLRTGEAERVAIATKKISDSKLYIDDESSISMDQMFSRALSISRKHKIGAIMIDYLQLMKLPREFSSDRTNGIAEISRGLKHMAKELDCPVIALSQLNRSLEQRPNKRPVNADLRESGAIEQDADLIMFVYRDEVYNPDSPDKGFAEVIIGKQRNGPLGVVKLGFANGRSRFESVGSGGVESLSSAAAKLADPGDLPARVGTYANLDFLDLDDNPL